MGYHMANNLLRGTNSEFHILDMDKSTLERFKTQNAEKNVHIAKTPKDLASKVDVVITMLPASKHVEHVYTGPDGLIEGIKKGAFLIDSSTIDPLTSKKIADIFKKDLDATVVDAPVSGGILGAEAGTLTFMVGSNTEKDFAKSQPYLTHMGKNIVYCGANGNGQVAKICNNMLLGIHMLGTSEAMNLGQKLGMDPKLLANILNTSSGKCWSSEIYNPCPGVIPTVPASRDYEGGFGVSLMAKDMGLAVDAANAVKANVMLGALSQQVYNLVSKTEGYEKKDFSSVYKWMGGKHCDHKE